jgi:uncharacterized protein YqcC (DUF446 family)
MDTMMFSQWLQFILIPRVHQIIEGHGTFPTNSMVGVKAMQKFDGDQYAEQLVSLLDKFDRLFSEYR